MNTTSAMCTSSYPIGRSRRLKLRDHVIPVHGRLKRKSVVVAYKRARAKRFMSNHTRRIYELYFIKHVGGNFLDSYNLVMKQNGVEFKELADLLGKYQIPKEPDAVADEFGFASPERSNVSIKTTAVKYKPGSSWASVDSPVPMSSPSSAWSSYSNSTHTSQSHENFDSILRNITPSPSQTPSSSMQLVQSLSSSSSSGSNSVQLLQNFSSPTSSMILQSLPSSPDVTSLATPTSITLASSFHLSQFYNITMEGMPFSTFNTPPTKQPDQAHKVLSTSSNQSSSPQVINFLPAAPTGRGRPKVDKGLERPGSSKVPKKFSEKMKAEAAVVQRVVELQKEGMWYDKRLPKAHDQPRMKSHWDYLIEEMQWLATDFAVERKWKRMAARKCAKMVEKYHADKKLAEEKAKKDEKIRIQKIAGFMGKEIRNFWSNVQKLVEYKEQSKIEELRKKAMDQHLSFIVDQTEKISSMLAESFSTEINPHRLALSHETAPESLSDLKVFDDSFNPSLSDDEFLPCQESEDDEETIAMAETEAKDVRGEVDLLNKESQMSIDDVLDDLPLEYVQALLSEDSDKKDTMDKSLEPSDTLDTKNETDYEPSGSESDIEDTIAEEERLDADAPQNTSIELKELEEDSKLSIEQLRAKYNKPIHGDYSDEEDSDIENGETESDSEEDDTEDEDDNESSDIANDGEDGASPEDQEQQISLASLLQTFAPERAGEDHGEDELNSVAAMAESFQPKGYTLSSTTVATKVPPLLKHTLREYQHIGLDWLVTMYDKKLNGILADEMGLGKTIQTIALLAHHAYERENWGPHLIIVPTSVMLNWEMEFKKWCPGFKILTYYGSIKERKLKRTGWTKPNSFHVCITSYKILIQDHQAFRRKRWRYLILDEAQNIKNFKSQRWQLLLNFSTQRRLLLTGTPLQNNLMELWSLMHFLMPNVFQSHREFREWFSNPVTGMIEGNSEYNENIIKRLHKVLRPFILRRLKCEVEKQLPQKYEHVVMCRLSKRQRYLYEDFMSRAKTKETLKQGNLLSVINILMQLRKVCNHPNLFEPRPIISPLQTRGLTYLIPSLIWNMMDDEAFNMTSYNLWGLTNNELMMDKAARKRIRTLITKHYFLSVHRPAGTPVMESISFPNNVPKEAVMKKLMQIKNNEEEEGEMEPVGDEDCAIVFEHKHDPTSMRRTVYTFNKCKIPIPPRLRTPFVLFTMDVKPPQSLLQDPEFIRGLTADCPSPKKLKPADFASKNWNRAPKRLFEFPGEQIFSADAAVEKPIPLKRKTKITKLSTSNFPTKLATTPNGSEILVTPNGVCVVQPEKPKQIKTTTIPYASRGIKRKLVHEYETKSLLDTIVVDFEAEPEVQIQTIIPARRTKGVINQPIGIPPTKRNGYDEDDGSDEYEDSEEELGQGPLRKIPRIDTSAKRKTRQNSESTKPKFSKYVEIPDEDDDYERLEPPSQKRKRSSLNHGKPKPLDLYNIELEDVVYRRICDRKAVITNMRAINTQRLFIHTVYGADLISQAHCLGVIPETRYYPKQAKYPFRKLVSRELEKRYHDSNGYFNLGLHEIMLIKRIKSSLTSEFEKNHPYSVWRHTNGLLSAIWTLEEIMDTLSGILKRFVFYTPCVAAPRIQFRVFHPCVSQYAAIQTQEQDISINMKFPLETLRPIFTSMVTQFPDPRLIQYDCGKLQVLDGLLRRLKSESHRILIFTQMAKMLDILEAFLNHHGYIYLRLDGATKIDQRQLLMERFNTDKRIFCFILSTRSGGIGVNLTGADTVIFYDSDWNPTMDAQAQDRCHRIGQTRDVHIYRLVSEKTIEENILKKSNQKRLLGELAIEGGNFTTAHFKKNTIHELFDVDERESDAKKRMAEILETPVPSPTSHGITSVGSLILRKDDATKKSATYIFESALAAAEDESDVQAARTVCAEAAAELAEFDEDIPLEDDVIEAEEQSKTDQEMTFIMNELSSIELYALRFMERTIDDWSKDTFANAQRELEQQKMEWELEQHDDKIVLGAPPPLYTVEEQLEDLLTYPRLPQDFWYDEMLGCEMMVYGPPTPPQDDEDVYIDRATGILYDIMNVISEHLLPPIWHGPKKSKTSSINSPVAKTITEETVPENIKKGGTPKVHRRDEPIFAPRSLFDRPSPALAKLRRDYKIQKLSKGTGSKFPVAMSIVSTTSSGSKTLGPGSITFPITLPRITQVVMSAPTDILEWTVPEDNYLLQSMTNMLELPVNLLIVNLAQTPNWDFATEVVNSISRIHRSTKQCRMRYEQVILPREEGKYFEPVPSAKKKKIKSFIKISPPPTSKGRRLKTSEIVANDNNQQYRNMYRRKFEAIKIISNERAPTGNPMPFNPNMRLPKQVSIFVEHQINYDSPTSAPAIASVRHERVMAERAKMIAAQRAQSEHSGMSSSLSNSSSHSSSISGMPSPLIQISPQIQVVQTIPQDQVLLSQSQQQGILLNSQKKLQQTQIMGQTSPSIIGTLTASSGILIPNQGTPTMTQRTLIQGSNNNSIQIHQTPKDILNQSQPIQIHQVQQGTGQTMILSQSQGSTVSSSSGSGLNTGFPIVIPVSSTNIVRTNSLIQQRPTTIHTQNQGNNQTAQKFIITQRDLQQPQQQQQQHIQLQPTHVQNQPIIISSTQGTSSMSNPITITTQTQILVSSGGTLSGSSGIIIPQQTSSTVSPRGQAFFQSSGTKQQIQINPQSKQVFISQADSQQILNSQGGQTMVISQNLGQSLNVNSPSPSQQTSLVVNSGTIPSPGNVITIPNKSQVLSHGQQVYSLHDLVSGSHLVSTSTSPQRSLTSSSPEVSEIESGNVSSSGTTVIGTLKSPQSQGPTFVPKSDITSLSDSSRTVAAGTTSGGNNIFVQLTGVPPGTKLTHSQIQQLRQSLLQQQKNFVVTPSQTSPQQIRLEGNQQMKRIQIVPTTQMTATSSNQIAIPVSTTLPTSSSPVQSIGNIVAINTGMGTRLVKQQIVGGKAITRPVSEADIQMLLKQRGFSQPGATRINVSTSPGLGITGRLAPGQVQGYEQGDGQVISGTGIQTVQSQTQSLLYPTKTVNVSAGTSSGGPQLITVPISQGQVMKTGVKNPIIATVCLQKGLGANPQVSLVRGTAPNTNLSSSNPLPMSYAAAKSDGKLSSVLEYQKANPYGLVSALSLARNATIPQQQVRRPIGTQTVVPTRSRYMVQTQSSASRENLISRPVTNPGTIPKSQLYTPISQVSLVRGTVPPISTTSTFLTTMPVTYSAAKTSILKTPISITETIIRPQLIQQNIPTTTHQSLTIAQSVSTLQTSSIDPPQLVNPTQVTTSSFVPVTTTLCPTTIGNSPVPSSSITNSNTTKVKSGSSQDASTVKSGEEHMEIGNPW